MSRAVGFGTKYFGVTGNPIKDSLSPEIWNAAFKEFHIDAVYLRLCAENGKDALSFAKEIGLSALSVTSPFKQTISDELEPVNAVMLGAGGEAKFFNTDVDGFLSSYLDIKNRPAKPALIIGAGGSARSAIIALKKAGEVNISLANRTKNKAQQLCTEFGLNLVDWDTVTQNIVDKYNVFTCISHNNVVNTDFDSDYYRTDFARRWLCYQAEILFKKFYDFEPYAIMKKTLDEALLKKRDKKSIALIGFMGTGKTFAGRALAEKKNLVFYDTDEIIEGRAGKSVAEIFAQDGEACFREMEKDVVRGLNFSKPCVVSCGGGLNLDEGNLKRIKDHCNVTWLWSDFEIICSRLRMDNSRPLFLYKTNAKKLFDERKPLYAKASDVCVRL